MRISPAAAASNAARARGMCQPLVTSTMCLIPDLRSSATLRPAFSCVSRELSSIHFSGRPNSLAAICAAMRASGMPSGWAQPTPPLKPTGSPVSRPSHRP
jgi:hypothetical protein